MISFKKIQGGNIKEFERLFRDLYEPLCRFANAFLHDSDKSEELVQDVFYRLWKEREKRKITTSIKSYLYAVTKNECLQLIQHLKVEERYKNYISLMRNEYYADPAKQLEYKEMNKRVEETLNSLPERCRQIFELNRYEGLKYKEIAKKLNISPKTVEANISKALKAFRINLKDADLAFTIILLLFI